MGQIKLHSRQLLAEVFRLIDEDRTSSILIYDDHHFIGKISYDEIVAFLNYKKDVGDIYQHKLNFELGTLLHIVRGMRSQALPGGPVPASKNKTLMVRLISVAVLAAVLLGFGWWFFRSGTDESSKSELVEKNVPLRTDKAVLTLADGKWINISDAKTGVIYRKAGMEIVKLDDEKIEYHLKEGDKTSATHTIHSISTPKGQQYEVVLSDGTRVWVNAASTIKFPSTFAALASRNVSLTGEAYFEVSHNKTQPFFVSAKDQEIQVLGTRFNVNAYDNESSIKTSLLEGSLRVTAKLVKQSVLLKPGEQSVLTNTGLSVKQIAAQESAAWKDGEFIFRNTRLEDIMRVIERQYDVKVIYHKPEAKSSLLGGSLALSSTLTDVLSTLELTSNTQFKVEGKRVTVL